MKRALLLFLGMLCFAKADEQAVQTNSVWSNELYGDEALPFAKQSLKDWYQEHDPAKRDKLAQEVIERANRADHPEIAEEILAGKPVAQAEIPIPTNAVLLPLTVIKEWDISNQPDRYAPVIRRIGPQNFELWTPKKGWLFNAKGEVLNEAKVPRRDGHGREWYGAFLPDGQWITTDLWERDDRLYQFSKEGKLINSFAVGDIAGWARADSTGTRWVVGVSGYGHLDDDINSSDLRIPPWGWKQRIGHSLKQLHIALPNSSWAFVEKIKSARGYVDPRKLGSRGSPWDIAAESDDRKASISWGEPQHGQWVGWPSYNMSASGQRWGHCIPWKDNDNFGFFPRSLTTWVGSNKYPLRPDMPIDEQRRAFEYFKSWLFDPTGKAIGWIAAERVGDDPDGKRMWFVDEKGRLLKVAPDGVISDVLQPTLSGVTVAEAPFAHVIFPDLKLGFFYTNPGHLVLARWP